MTYEEALEWLKGKKSMANCISSEDPDMWQIRIVQADAAMIEQAYWIVRAHNEKLIYQEGLVGCMTQKGDGR